MAKKLNDYVVTLCRIGGTEVMAVRMDGFASKYDREFFEAVKERYPGWKVKNILRLDEGDFT